jgi:uncharacterized membrane protein
MQIFHQFGLSGAFRISHVIVAVMWMGLLWFFNFVQTPAFAEMDPQSRNVAMDKITWRALWWFRWAAAATVVFGLLIIAVGSMGKEKVYTGDYWLKSAAGVTLLLGIVMGLVMAANVWMIIWPKQQIVIGNARNLIAGGEADPNAAAAGRAGAMASRQNTIFSLPLLVFMVGASHFYLGDHWTATSSGKCITYLIVGLILIAVLELNAVGKISGRGNTGLNVIYETHKNAMYTGFGLIVFFYVFAEILLRS